MNDYTRGIIEALTWVLLETEFAVIRKRTLVWLQGEIEDVREDALQAAAVDFPHRVKAVG